jgi:hypothetical protein
MNEGRGGAAFPDPWIARRAGGHKTPKAIAIFARGAT